MSMSMSLHTDLLTLDPRQDDLFGDAGVDRLGQLEVDGSHDGDQHGLLRAGDLKQ